MQKRADFIALFLCVGLAACGGSKRSNQWDIDYSSVYKAYGNREIDNSYKAPSVIGCVDDDLYNCQ